MSDVIPRALQLMENGKVDEAINLLSTRIQRTSDPLSLYSLYEQRGLLFMEHKDYHCAINDFSQVIHYLNNSNVLQIIRQSIKVIDQLVGSYVDRSQCYENIGKYKEALQDLDSAISKKLTSEYEGELRVQKAYILTLYLKKPKESLIEIKLALKNRSTLSKKLVAQLYSFQAVNHDILKNYKRYIVSATESIEIDPSHILNYTLRYKAYDLTGEWEKAIADLEYILKQSFNSQERKADLYSTYSCLYTKLAQYDKALININKAVNMTKGANRVQFIWNRAGTYFFMKNYDESIKDVNTVLELDPNYPTGFLFRAHLYRCKRQLIEALEDCNSATKYSGSHADYFERSIVLYELGMYNLAIADCQHSLDIFPHIKSAKILLELISSCTRPSIPYELTEYDFALSEKDPQDSYKCEFCRKISIQKLKRCSKCRYVFYCGTDCQKKGM
jgi:tetratricopeptide (TPR) repeat protein